MDTDSLCLELAEKALCDCIRSEKRQQWEFLRCKDSNDLLTADACSIFSPDLLC